MDSLQKTAERIGAVGTSKVLVRSCDTSSETAVKGLYEDLREHFDKVDVLINSAGALNAGLIGDIEPALWWENFVRISPMSIDSIIPANLHITLQEANVKGPHLMIHHFLKHFGGLGTVITISSAASSVVHPAMSGYAAAKLAMNRVDECLQAGT